MAQRANLTTTQSIKQNLKTFTYERGNEWEHLSIDAVRSFMAYAPTNKVVELGCGDGAAIAEFTKHHYHVTGVDINPLKLAKIPQDIPTVQSDILAYLRRHPDNSLPNIFCHHTLEHCVHYQEILKEIGRTLRPNNIAYIVVPKDHELHSVHHVVFESPEEITVPGLVTIYNDFEIRSGQEYRYVGRKG